MVLARNAGLSPIGVTEISDGTGGTGMSKVPETPVIWPGFPERSPIRDVALTSTPAIGDWSGVAVSTTPVAYPSCSRKTYPRLTLWLRPTSVHVWFPTYSGAVNRSATAPTIVGRLNAPLAPLVVLEQRPGRHEVAPNGSAITVAPLIGRPYV